MARDSKIPLKAESQASSEMAKADLSKAELAKQEIDHELIRALAKLLDETGLTEIEFERGGQRVRVARHGPAAVAVAPVLRATTVSLGGDLVRQSPTVTFTQPGGDAELLGLYFADAGQHLEHRLLVDHAVPHCRSNVAYKGALQGSPGQPEAHTVWIGDVLIQAAAEGTETFEVNRNLVLTDGARADSVPNLEIETGEIVGAGHASATGRFDNQQLFYLT